MLFLIIIASLLVLITAINDIVANKRQVYFNEMNILYERMEQYVYINRLYDNAVVIQYLQWLRNLGQNRNYADIQVLSTLIARQSIQSILAMKKQIDNAESQLPVELKLFANEFRRHMGAAIGLSFFRPKFILFFCYQLTAAIWNAIFERSISAIKNLFTNIRNAMKYQNVIVSNAMGVS